MVSVCVITDEIVPWWEKIKLSNYENFIKNFDLDEIKKFLNDKLVQIKEKYSQFTINCEMICVIDLEHDFFKNNWTPYILKGYYYNEVNNKWDARTQKGGGDFSGFRIWTKDILNMDKKQIKKLIKN